MGCATGITELVGPAGVGKTQMCLMLAASACMSTARNSGHDRRDDDESTSEHHSRTRTSSVIYIDTESKFSSARLVEIATRRFPDHYGTAAAVAALTNRIVILTPRSSAELLERLEAMDAVVTDRNVRLIIIDSIAALPRAEYSNSRTVERQEVCGRLHGVRLGSGRMRG
jgi:RAD51-like protein 1